MQPTPVFLLGESHGQKSLASYSPWGRKESVTTEATEHARTSFEPLGAGKTGGLQPLHTHTHTHTHTHKELVLFRLGGGIGKDSVCVCVCMCVYV